MSTTPLYNQEIINIGTSPNDGSGDPLRVAFDKINNNFTNLFQTFVNSTVSYTIGNTANQIIFETPVETFTQGQFYIRTVNGGTPDSQSIQLFAQINNLHDDVKFTGYGTTFYGNALSNYDMVVTGNTVQILANPLVNEDMTHLINSQIMYAGPNIMTPYLSVDGYVDTNLSTESNIGITVGQQI